MTSPLAGRRVLLGVTGGIAAYKVAYLARLLRERGAEVQVAMTPSATRFVGPDTFAALTGHPVHSDVFERSDVVLHVRLAREADVAVVAPATANVIAKLALGLGDDLLTSTLLEFTGPLAVAPAMHTGMYGHPATQAHLETLRERGVTVVGPVTGPLAAGDEGPGRMSDPEEIADAVEALLTGATDLSGRRLLVTAGPTHEPIDPVRFLGNRSSGKMGYLIAQEAARRGAVVTLVSGPTGLVPPAGVDVVSVETAEEMRDAVLARFEEGLDAVVKAAAVADFRPKVAAEGKIKKETGPPELHLEPTPDILRELGERKGDTVLVGFAAETEDFENAARTKLREKHLDLVVVNQVGAPDTGFEADTNRAMVVGASGDDLPMRTWTKAELASAILDRVAAILGP
ncbi:MAG: bifunctional phosphopantothenoylcysteine decarboxylase/phosphopantothenate--cysteine ligase CoaBC [Actinomycetota bacterium]|nr:bifunctional phosphopantothenoylcysteine decarboxylase/phosphopantothenate--cysteine ligase CoaBC [Actinomycetota bacterium]